MLLLPLLLLSPVAATQVAAPRASCPQDDLRAAAATRAPGARTLGDQPSASLYRAVDRRIAGCRAPVILRTGIGKR